MGVAKTVGKLISVLKPVSGKPISVLRLSTMRDEWVPRRQWAALLRRRDNAAWRFGFWDRMRSAWRVTDAIGRTSGKLPFNVARLFTYHGPVEPPGVPKQ